MLVMYILYGYIEGPCS